MYLHDGGSRPRRGDDRGAAAVEFALVLPVLVLLLFGIVDFGRLLNAEITLTQAAREGARVAALVDADAAADQITRATGSLSGGLAAPEIVACPATPGLDDDASVTLTYTFTFLTPVGALASIGGSDGTVEIEATGVMPCL
jgi:Flp pilus assembly protein TadG